MTFKLIKGLRVRRSDGTEDTLYFLVLHLRLHFSIRYVHSLVVPHAAQPLKFHFHWPSTNLTLLLESPPKEENWVQVKGKNSQTQEM